MFDPSLGRWLEPDPIGFEGGNVNLYGFVGDDPTDAIDPSGLKPPPSSNYNNQLENLLDQYQRTQDLGIPSDILADVSPRVEKGGIVLNKGGGLGDWALSKGKDVAAKVAEIIKARLAKGQLKNCDCIATALKDLDGIENAARHLLWQAAITVKYGYMTATAVGNAHDDPSEIRAQDSAIDIFNNHIGRDIGTAVLGDLQKKYPGKITIRTQKIRSNLIFLGTGRTAKIEWEVDRFTNWSDYQGEIEKAIEDKVLGTLVDTLSLCERSRKDKLPILNPTHPYIKDNSRYSKLPPY